MIYIVLWLFCFAMLACAVRFPDRARWYCAAAVCAMGLFAVFRGATGTDTAAYEQISALARSGGIFATGAEPFFAVVLKALQLTGLSDAGVVRMVSALEVGLLLTYIGRSVPNERYLLLAAILPAFFYEYTMNALRIGLASILFLLALQAVSRHRKPSHAALGLALAASVTHYTAIFYPLFGVAALRRWSRRLVLGGVLIGALVFAAVFLLQHAYLMAKLQSYESLRAPSRFSGLSSVIQIALVSAAIWKSTLSRPRKGQLLTLALLLTAAFMGLVQFSYAGLRLLDLVVFVLPPTMVAAHELENKPMNLQARLGLLAFGLVSTVFVFRRFLVESPDSLAPFLPYHLIFS
ncbi:EpsG family protein [Castellaniella sp.]|uniref:EpsG family protein n=1 Tax=Castellaniella sp. TaxID=1955812 RepID=UPI003D0E3E75